MIPKRRINPRGRTKKPRADLIDLAINERANLANAESTLRILKIALIHERSRTAESPYYANVVELAANTIARSIRALDSLHLADVATME